MVFAEMYGTAVWTAGPIISFGLRYKVPFFAQFSPFIFWGTAIFAMALITRKLVAGPRLPKEIENIDLTGKRIIVTGPAAGLGYQSALFFATHGAEVILGARSVKRNEETAKKLRQDPEAKGKELKLITRYPYEAEDLKSVKKFAQDILADGDKKIDVLMNNAGLINGSNANTSKHHPNIEFTNCINVFAPVVLTETMKDRIKKDGTRVVMLSSSAHQFVPSHKGVVDCFKDLVNDKGLDAAAFEKQITSIGNSMYTYGMSKLHNKYYADYLKSQGIDACSVHPGPVSTNFLHTYGAAAKAFATVAFPFIMAKYEDEGTWPQIYASLVKDLPSPSYLKSVDDKEKKDKLVTQEAVFIADSVAANDQMTKLGRDLEAANSVMEWTMEKAKEFI